jgi:integrase
MRLTKANIERIKLPPEKSEMIVFDESLPGFGLRIRAGGKRTWIAQYRFGSKQRRVTLASVATCDAENARERAKETLARVHLGQDPQALKMAARAPKVSELTLGELVELYLPSAQTRLKQSTYSGVSLHLRKHWRQLHAVSIREVERRHVAVALGRIAKDSGLYGANRSRAALSSLFSWAIGEGLAERNPVVGTNKATDEEARDRVLSEAELAAVWHSAGLGDYAVIVRLLILTGQRREEVGGILWSEIDMAGAVWSIGANRTKNGLAHDVPLSAPALTILKGLHRRKGRDLVFGSREGPFQGWSNAKSALDGRVTSGLGRAPPPWRLHDLRRTVATRLGDIGVLPHVVEAILNHVSGHRAGVAGVYNRTTYAAEKRFALGNWAEHIAATVDAPI